MARTNGSASGEVRSSALWGTGTRGGEHRSSALWGTSNRGGENRGNALWGTGRGRGLATMVVAVFALAVPLGAAAGDGSSYLAPGLAKKASSSPGDKVRVIVQARGGTTAAATAVKGLGSVKRQLTSVGGVAIELPAAALARLQDVPGLTITPDAPVRVNALSSNQLWPYAQNLAPLWGSYLSPAPQAPAIAIIDSGIENRLSDFGTRIKASVKLSQSPYESPGDGRGHGTLVAAIAAGSGLGYAGAAPNAPLVDVDVIDNRGAAYVSDVIAGIDWVLANKSRYNIRVANLSFGAPAGSMKYNPLNDAVEKLWFSGVVVVASAGNYGTDGSQTNIKTAPANDPFIITVGAADMGSSQGITDDTMAPWSAWGFTADGFRKPDLAASGRSMAGPVPSTSTLALERPLSVLSPGYMRLSGTSFAAPAVAGAAAQILARRPTWTPDQVKGALLLKARKMPAVPNKAGGFGELDAAAAASVTNPPNPNAGLNKFLRADPAGGNLPVFDEAAWAETARTNAAWNEAAWNEAAWAEAAWAEAAWAEAAWAEAAWAEAAWAEAAWAEAAWAEAAWAESLQDNAE
jgi:serine protease AprX